MKRWLRQLTVYGLMALMVTGCSQQKQSVDELIPRSSTSDFPQSYISTSEQKTTVVAQTSRQAAANSSPSASVSEQRPQPKFVKGIYIAGLLASPARLEPIKKLLDRSELNAVVADIKNDGGYSLLTDDLRGKTARASIKELKEKGIYLIGRLVTFKDPRLAAERPNLAMHTKSGAVWHDRKGISWVNPFDPEVWNYNIRLAKMAVQAGFDEIQFDYVRFPENGKKVDREVQLLNPQGLSKEQAIQGFLQEAKSQVGGKNVKISADVFGLTTSVDDDMGIGQSWMGIVQKVDVISPMIYPSHYSKGMYGLSQPDIHPYLVVSNAMADANRKNAALARHAVIRPWLQDFTATWVKPHLKYGKTEVSEQIKAAKEQGIEEFLLWNPKAQYTFG